MSSPLVEGTLVRLLQSSSPPAPTEALDHHAWRQVIALAHLHHVAGLLRHRLRERHQLTQLPDDLARDLADAERRTVVRSLQQQAAFLDVSAHLTAAGMPVLALKGLQLAATVYPAPGLRPMSDIDLLVTREHARPARAALLALGFVPESPDDPDRDLETSHHFVPLLRGGVKVELHWTLVPPSRRPGTLDVAGLFARATHFPLQGTPVLGLSPVDLLAHLCAHASHQHLFEQRLSAVWDVALTITHHQAELDWDRLTAVVRTWQTARGTCLALRLVANLTGTAIPIDVIEARLGRAPDEVVAAACAQVFRPADVVPISHNVTRLLDRRVPVRERLRLLWRGALTGPLPASADARVSSRPRKLWTRPMTLARLYAARVTRLRTSGLTTLAARRNAVAGWLNPPGAAHNPRSQ